jgi:murein L,D-transpeptidase YafK
MRRALSCLGLGLCLGAAQPPSPTTPAKAGSVNRVTISKGTHTMELWTGETLVRRYRVAIGPGGAGPKLREGDKVTPTGRYHVVDGVPSQFHVFMRLDYPNADDWARFNKLKAEGKLPKDARIGGDIGIHGAPPAPEWKSMHKTVDWTLGCIAVDDAEIEEIDRLVPGGTIVDITD